MLFRSIELQIKQLWRCLKLSNTNFSIRTLTIYSKYFELILLDPKKATKIHKIMLNGCLDHENDYLLQYAENGNAVIVIAPQEVGTIVKHNSSMCELTGYTKEELIGMSIENFIPMIYRDNHKRGFNQWILNNKKDIKKLNFNKQTVIKHRYGNIIPVYIKLITTSSYTNTQCFTLTISKDIANNEFRILHILTDKKKNILDMSSSNFFLNNRCKFII